MSECEINCPLLLALKHNDTGPYRGNFWDQSLAVCQKDGLYTPKRENIPPPVGSENSESFCSEEQEIIASPA